MLRFHILNVGQGDSIVIEHIIDNERSFGVVDSNTQSGTSPRALDKLHELGAEKLSFVCLTHPHRDHYRGLSHILQGYVGKIGQFFTFPAGEFIGANVEKLAEKYLKIANETDDQDIIDDVYEFIRILQWLDKHIGMSNIPECAGPYSQIPVQDFSGAEVFCILPFREMKGSYLPRIRDNDPTIFESEKENDLSLALVFRYKGVSAILGGDATHENWRKLLHKQNTTNLPSIYSTAVKLPHHGSKRDCTNDTFDVVFENDENADRYALISANGIKHPHGDVLQALEKRGVKPYCTNLHSNCGANVHKLINASGLDPLLGKYLNQLSVEAPPQPCQGDITFTIFDDGTYDIDRELKVPCGYRGEFDGLFTAT